ncbi:winged helix-turn-helix transcriptional regulator [Actinoplanes sp. URMC 104]|uniref:winged helix-turn-helix transcriptional regulator n=1 Tax=Actinoplanes sp. URMC 104 TaxID=3423409 RepID=UPI003F1B2F3F
MSEGHANFVDELSDRLSWSADQCPAGRALEIVGTRSAMLIMREAYFGTTRFDDFTQRVGITEAIAAARLRELTAAGLLERQPYREPGRRTRYEYRLTRMGRDLSPVILGLYRWGSKYLFPDGLPPVELSHSECGAPVKISVRCAEGHPVPLDEVTVSPTSAMRQA